MKWKITTQFFIATIVTLILALNFFMISNVLIKYSFNKSKIKDSENIYSKINFAPGAFVEEFSKNIEYVEGKISIPEEYLSTLKKNNIWLQILNENGEEIYNIFKPEDVQSKYSARDIIYHSKYYWAIPGYSTFLSSLEKGNAKLICIMAFPYDKTAKVSLSFSLESLFNDMFWRVIVATGIIILIIGYIFSQSFAKPIANIIKGIEDLSKGIYIRYPTKGIYKEVQQGLNKLSEDLQFNEKEKTRIDNTRQQWIANISHDIKTPLASIRGYAEIIMDEDYNIEIEESRKYAKIILDKSNYIESLVEDLNITYRLKSSLAPIKKKEVNIVDVVRESIISILNHPAYEKANIDFLSEKESILFSCDEGLFQRGITNLVYNALVHNPESTRIAVRIILEERLIIEIEDEGKGIPEEELENLFERYYRGTNTGEEHKGSGLGMAIAKQIVEAHGGSIEITSKLQQGTLIRMIF